MNPFDYVTTNDITEAMRQAKDPKAHYLAGGTDILIKIKNHRLQPDSLVDLKKLSALSALNFTDRLAEIGALTTIREIETSPQINEHMNMLSSAAGKLGSVQVRNLATIGGNICNAAPSAETAPALLCLEAELEIIGTAGKRRIPIDQFFTGPGQTVLEKGELLSKFVINLPPRSARGVYHKLSVRQALDIAFVGVAVLLDVADEKIINAKIGLGAVAPVPMRAYQAEKILIGNRLTKELALQAASMAADECKPISDLRASAEYRKDMVRELTEQSLWQTYHRN